MEPAVCGDMVLLCGLSCRPGRDEHYKLLVPHYHLGMLNGSKDDVLVVSLKNVDCNMLAIFPRPCSYHTALCVVAEELFKP